jgi:hypothetical protein
MVDADERRRPFREPLNQPLSDSLASLIFARTGRLLDFVFGSQTAGPVDAQPLEARLGRLCAGVVDVDEAVEFGVHISELTESGGYYALAARSVLTFAQRAF